MEMTPCPHKGKLVRVTMPGSRCQRMGIWTRTVERGRKRGWAEVYVWRATNVWKRFLLPPDDVEEYKPR